MTQQATLTGETNAVRRKQCDYFEGCHGDAEFEVEVLIYGQGQKHIAACESCAKEQIEATAEIRLDDLRRLKPSDRWFLEGEQERGESP